MVLDNEDTPASTPLTYIVNPPVTAMRVPVQKDPAQGNNIIGYLKAGTAVTVLSKSELWLRIQLPNKQQGSIQSVYARPATASERVTTQTETASIAGKPASTAIQNKPTEIVGPGRPVSTINGNTAEAMAGSKRSTSTFGTSGITPVETRSSSVWDDPYLASRVKPRATKRGGTLGLLSLAFGMGLLGYYLTGVQMCEIVGIFSQCTMPFVGLGIAIIVIGCIVGASGIIMFIAKLANPPQ